MTVLELRDKLTELIEGENGEELSGYKIELRTADYVKGIASTSGCRIVYKHPLVDIVRLEGSTGI